jgi:hypothetical protein
MLIVRILRIPSKSDSERLNLAMSHRPPQIPHLKVSGHFPNGPSAVLSPYEMRLCILPGQSFLL